MVKKFLWLIIFTLTLVCISSCNQLNEKNNKQSNSYARILSTVNAFEFEPNDYEYLSTDSLNYLGKYIKIIESKQYSYVFIKTGVGENNQMTEISRSQNGSDFYETDLIVANDSFPDSIITKKLDGSEYCEVIDDGINEKKVKYPQIYNSNGEIEKIFENLELNNAYTLLSKSDYYYCESYNNSTQNREYYFYFNRNGSLLGIGYKTLNNTFLFYYAISFDTKTSNT